jgi:ribonuclease HI
MVSLSPGARRIAERLLAGESLNDIAAPGDPARGEIEDYLASALGSSPPVGLPADRRAVAYADGASRGNPGPAAYGIRIVAGDGTELYAEGRAIGRATNNVAEYRAAVTVLRKALELGLDRIELRLDSELVVKQLTGQYRVRQPALVELKAEIDSVVRRFESFRVRHVPRERNAEADRLANRALDRL